MPNRPRRGAVMRPAQRWPERPACRGHEPQPLVRRIERQGPCMGRRKSRAVLRKVVKALADGSAIELSGYEVGEVLKKKTDLLYHDRRTDAHKGCEIFESLESEGFHIGTATGITKNGDTVPLEIITAKLRGRDGAVLLLRLVRAGLPEERHLHEQAL